MNCLERFVQIIIEKNKIHKPEKVKPPVELPEEDPSEDLEFFLSPGNIEKLVVEGRIPLKIGEITDENGEKKPYFQVPPRGFNPDIVDHAYMSTSGAYSFVYNDGSQRIGSTYTLTNEQAQQVNERVKNEKKRLKQARKKRK